MTTRRTTSAALLLAAALGAPVARADEWDLGPNSDDGIGLTNNALFHGSRQIHDVVSWGAAGDVDWYMFSSRPYSSYQFVVDGQSGGTHISFEHIQRFTRRLGCSASRALSASNTTAATAACPARRSRSSPRPALRSIRRSSRGRTDDD